MTLEFERLTADLEKMALTTARRYELRRERLDEMRATLQNHRTNWTAVTNAWPAPATKPTPNSTVRPGRSTRTSRWIRP